MDKRLIGAIGLALGALVPVAAYAETLNDTLATAYRGNPALASERAHLRSVNEGVPQALSNWRPTVTLNADASRRWSTSNTYAGKQNRTFDPRNYDLLLTQPVYRGGRTVAGTNRAEQAVLAERARLTNTEQSVLLAAATAYLDLLRDQATVELRLKNEQVLARQLEATRDRFRVGEVTRTDVSQAEARLAGAIADRIQAEGAVQVSRAQYQRVVGVAPATLVPPEPFAKLPENIQRATEAAAATNPGVVAARYDEAAARENIDLVEGELLPTVTLNGDVARNVDVLGPDQRTDGKSIIARVSVPIYESGSVWSRTRQAKEDASQKRNDIETARRDAVNGATTNWESLQTARARVSSIDSQIKAAEIALEGVRREAEVGARTVLDVLNAEQELVTAQVSLVQAHHDEFVSTYQLASAVGQFTAQALGLSVEAYEPDKDYRAVRDKWWGADTASPATP